MAALGVLGLRTVAKLGAFIPAVTALPHLNVTGLNPQGFTPNIVAGAIAPLIPLGIAWGLARPRGERAVAWLLAAGMSVVLVLTESRGALLGVALALLVMVLWKTPWSARLAFLLALLTVSVVGLAFGIRPLDAMLATDSTGTVAGRLELWDRAVMILRDFSFTGVGLGGYERIVRTFYPLFQNSPGDPVPHAHNMYLQMGVDFGAGGLVALLGLITTAFMTGTANVWQTRAQASQVLSGPLTAQAEHWLALGLLAALVVIAVHGLLDAVWLSTKVSVVVWYLLGLIVALNLQVAPKMDRTGPGVNYVTGNI
jgi:putative inorganic carbon (HCO3(-)) transporter